MIASPPAHSLPFPAWINRALPVGVLLVVLGGTYWMGVIVLGFLPSTQRVGYAPSQPVAYSHALHAGKLGIDCRYCHNSVEETAHASIPPTQTCMNCHATIRAESTQLIKIRESWSTGLPVEWVRVHDLPDFVYFNHSAHVNRGVGCESCHGRIDKQEVVTQVESLTMGWCLGCHRDPEPNLRPRSETTTMGFVPLESDLGERLMAEYNIRSPEELTDCTLCHR